jgi:hypothetical protein
MFEQAIQAASAAAQKKIEALDRSLASYLVMAAWRVHTLGSESR